MQTNKNLAFIAFGALVLLYFSFLLPEIRAEENEDEGECSVGVRIIGAKEQSDSTLVNAPKEQDQFEDVREQLKQLPFAHYRTLDYSEKNIKFFHLARFVLQGAEQGKHIVSIMPHDLTNGKVQITVDWSSGGVFHLVSTRMRMFNGKHLILGSDGSSNLSTILCIKALCHTGRSIEPEPKQSGNN